MFLFKLFDPCLMLGQFITRCINDRKLNLHTLTGVFILTLFRLLQGIYIKGNLSTRHGKVDICQNLGIQ